MSEENRTNAPEEELTQEDINSLKKIRMDSCCDNLRLPHIHTYRSAVYMVYCVRRYDK